MAAFHQIPELGQHTEALAACDPLQTLRTPSTRLNPITAIKAEGRLNGRLGVGDWSELIGHMNQREQREN
jgi:hypothetical protein